MAVDLNTLTPQQMCAGLMRGNAAEFKLGYRWDSAVLATQEYLQVSNHDDQADLHSFARGFADGMAVALERANPGKAFLSAINDTLAARYGLCRLVNGWAMFGRKEVR